jgi:hypothetical protein
MSHNNVVGLVADIQILSSTYIATSVNNGISGIRHVATWWRHRQHAAADGTSITSHVAASLATSAAETAPPPAKRQAVVAAEHRHSHRSASAGHTWQHSVTAVGCLAGQPQTAAVASLLGSPGGRAAAGELDQVSMWLAPWCSCRRAAATDGVMVCSRRWCSCMRGSFTLEHRGRRWP